MHNTVRYKHTYTYVQSRSYISSVWGSLKLAPTSYSIHNLLTWCSWSKRICSWNGPFHSTWSWSHTGTGNGAQERQSWTQNRQGILQQHPHHRRLHPTMCGSLLHCSCLQPHQKTGHMDDPHRLLAVESYAILQNHQHCMNTSAL